MKHVKKLASILLALVMVFGTATTAFAANNDGSVTVNNAIPGEKYNIYKVFDLTYSGNGQTTTEGSTTTTDPYDSVAYTYTKANDSDAFYTALTGESSPFTLTETTIANVYTVALKENKGATDVSTFLKANEGILTKAGTEQTAPAATAPSTTSTVKWKDLAYGYYYVTSSVGTTVTIDSTLRDVVVEDKNSLPSQDKKQVTGTTAPTGSNGYTDDQQDVQVGDTVWYQVAVTIGKGTNQSIKITDTMSSGLTFNGANSISVTLKSGANDEATVENTGNANYTVDTTDINSTFVLTLKADYVKTLKEGDVVYIRYSATVNSNAITAAETNTSKMEYSNQATTDTVSVVTYKFQLDKTDKNYADLKGATFELYRESVADGNKVHFKTGTAENGIPVIVVVPSDSTEPGTFTQIKLTDDADGLKSSKVIIKGLDKGAYVLREVEAPHGYNKAEDTSIADTTLVKIDGTITDVVNTTVGDAGVVTVINNTGAELPSTGGMGTTIFYVVGSILLIGAVVLLITKKRMNAKK